MVGKHVGKSFAEAGGPVASKSKFQGEKPGRAFKLWSEGLGYYTDVGRVLTVHPFLGVAP